jgi:hypothetical protein
MIRTFFKTNDLFTGSITTQKEKEKQKVYNLRKLEMPLGRTVPQY